MQLIAQQLGIEQLLGVLPLIEGLGFVQSFVALEAYEPPIGDPRQRFGQFGLSHPGGPLDEDWLSESQRQEGDLGDPRIRQIIDTSQRLGNRGRRRKRIRHADAPIGVWARGECTGGWWRRDRSMGAIRAKAGILSPSTH